jgi:hypothetical protein
MIRFKMLLLSALTVAMLLGSRDMAKAAPLC